MKSHSGLPKNLLTLGLCLLVAFDVTSPVAFAQGLPARIEIVVVEGEGVINDVRQRTTRNLVVRVEDDDHRPLAGASVVFALPISGASGEFANGSKNLAAVTNQDGVAVANGLRANDIPGKLQIYVTASYRGLRASALINQSIEGVPLSARPDLRPRKPGNWKWIVLGVVAAAGAGGGIYFSSRTPSASAPISITPGPIVFGSPR